MELQSRILTVDNIDRHSWLHVPPQSTAPKPLVIFLHGSNQNGAVMAEHWGDAGQDEAFFLFPTALQSPGQDGQLETHWAASGVLSGADPRQDVRFLLAQISALREEFDWIGDIYLGGFSSGGKLVLDILLSDNPEDFLFAGFAVCSRSLPPEWIERTITSPLPVRLISLIGDADGKGEWVGTGQNLPAEETRDWLVTALGLSPEPTTQTAVTPRGAHAFERWDWDSDADDFRWVRYHNGGHTFFRPADGYTPGAAKEILRFFGITTA